MTPVEEKKAPATNPDFDLDLYRDETTTKAISSIWKIMGDNADKIAFDRKSTNESISAVIEDVAKLVMESLIENKVVDNDMQHLMQNFQVFLELIWKEIKREKEGFETELLARTIGTRHPKDGVYSREYATIADMYLTLLKVRDSQGNNSLDYFYHNPKPAEAQPAAEENPGVENPPKEAEVAQ